MMETIWPIFQCKNGKKRCLNVSITNEPVNVFFCGKILNYCAFSSKDVKNNDCFSEDVVPLQHSRSFPCRDVNIMDNIMALIEQHTDNLEALVEERTRLLMEEKKKTDKLLYKMLPV